MQSTRAFGLVTFLCDLEGHTRNEQEYSRIPTLKKNQYECCKTSNQATVISSTNLCFGHPGVTVLVIEAEYDLDKDKKHQRGGLVDWGDELNGRGRVRTVKAISCQERIGWI